MMPLHYVRLWWVFEGELFYACATHIEAPLLIRGSIKVARIPWARQGYPAVWRRPSGAGRSWGMPYAHGQEMTQRHSPCPCT